MPHAYDQTGYGTVTATTHILFMLGPWGSTPPCPRLLYSQWPRNVGSTLTSAHLEQPLVVIDARQLMLLCLELCKEML